MVFLAAPAVTKVGFRRDIRLFFGVLVGFLVVIILVLILLLQTLVNGNEEATHARWETTADAARDVIDRQPAFDAAVVEAQLVAIRAKFDVAGIELRPFDSPYPIHDGYLKGDSLVVYDRATHLGRLLIAFDDSDLTRMQRGFKLTAIISITATVFGTILLLLYLPTITRPIEQMLDHARELGDDVAGNDEATYLIETFRRSIETLKRQEEELTRLHQIEKTRADDLQRITATLTRSLSSGFVALDAAGRVVDMNAAAREILSLDGGADLSNATLHDLLGDTAFSRCLADALEKQLSLTRQEIVQRAPAGEIVIGLTTVPLIDENGEFLGLLALFTDLTPIRGLETRVREMQTLADLGEMSAGIAHEFRNSLATILGYLKLASRAGSSEEVEKKIRSAEEEANELSSAVEALLNFARPMKLDLQNVSILDVIRPMVARMKQAAGDVEISVEGDDAFVQGDPRLLTRAFENLVRNAVEAVKANDEAERHVSIVVHASPVPSVQIHDDGSGIDPAQVAKLFLPFQSTKSTGMGLGLPLAKKIVLLHEGTIRVESRQGEGTSVFLTFPRIA